MATTSIGSDRQQGSPLEKYTDALFVRDDVKLYFGNDGDLSMEYDEDGNDVFLFGGTAHIRVPDDKQLQFGTGNDVKLYFDGTNFLLKGLPTSDPSASDALYLANNSDLTLSTG